MRWKARRVSTAAAVVFGLLWFLLAATMHRPPTASASASASALTATMRRHQQQQQQQRQHRQPDEDDELQRQRAAAAAEGDARAPQEAATSSAQPPPRAPPPPALIVRPRPWIQSSNEHGVALMTSGPYVVRAQGSVAFGLLLPLAAMAQSSGGATAAEGEAVLPQFECVFDNDDDPDGVYQYSETTSTHAVTVRVPRPRWQPQARAAAEAHVPSPFDNHEPVNVFCDVPAHTWLIVRHQLNPPHKTTTTLRIVLTGPWTFAKVEALVEEPQQPAPISFCLAPWPFAPSYDEHMPFRHYHLQRMIEYFEYHAAIGVAHFHVYLHTPPAETDQLARKFLHYYVVKRRLVTFVDFSLASEQMQAHAQAVALNDCLLQQKMASHYAFFAELDDFLVVPAGMDMSSRFFLLRRDTLKNFLFHKEASVQAASRETIVHNLLTHIALAQSAVATTVCSANANANANANVNANAAADAEGQRLTLPMQGMITPYFRWRRPARTVSSGAAAGDAAAPVVSVPRNIVRTRFVASVNLGDAVVDDLVCGAEKVRVHVGEVEFNVKPHCMAVTERPSAALVYKFGDDAMIHPVPCADPPPLLQPSAPGGGGDGDERLIYDTLLSATFASALGPLVRIVWDDVFAGTEVHRAQFGPAA